MKNQLLSSESNEWYTPSNIVEKARRVMGSIQLDPASNKLAQDWIQADMWFGLDHPERANRNGYLADWPRDLKTILLNPPYGMRKIRGPNPNYGASLWLQKAIEHYNDNTNIQVHIICRGDSASVKWIEAHAISVTPHQRIRFIQPNSNRSKSPLPGVKIYGLGVDWELFYEEWNEIGTVRIPYETSRCRKTSISSTSVPALAPAFRWPPALSEASTSSGCARETLIAQEFSRVDIQEFGCTKMSINSPQQPQGTSTSLQPALLANLFPSLEKDKESTTVETVSLPWCDLLEWHPRSILLSKMWWDYLAAHFGQVRQRVATSNSSYKTCRGGTVWNGSRFPAPCLSHLSTENGYFYLESPSAMSCPPGSKYAPPGQTPLEWRLTKLGVLKKRECLHPETLESFYELPTGWTDPLEPRSAIELIARDGLHLEMPSIGGLQLSHSPESSKFQELGDKTMQATETLQIEDQNLFNQVESVSGESPLTFHEIPLDSSEAPLAFDEAPPVSSETPSFYKMKGRILAIEEEVEDLKKKTRDREVEVALLRTEAASLLQLEFTSKLKELQELMGYAQEFDLTGSFQEEMQTMYRQGSNATSEKSEELMTSAPEPIPVPEPIPGPGPEPEPEPKPEPEHEPEPEGPEIVPTRFEIKFSTEKGSVARAKKWEAFLDSSTFPGLEKARALLNIRELTIAPISDEVWNLLNAVDWKAEPSDEILLAAQEKQSPSTDESSPTIQTSPVETITQPSAEIPLEKEQTVLQLDSEPKSELDWLNQQLDLELARVGWPSYMEEEYLIKNYDAIKKISKNRTRRGREACDGEQIKRWYLELSSFPTAATALARGYEFTVTEKVTRRRIGDDGEYYGVEKYKLLFKGSREEWLNSAVWAIREWDIDEVEILTEQKPPSSFPKIFDFPNAVLAKEWEKWFMQITTEKFLGQKVKVSRPPQSSSVYLRGLTAKELNILNNIQLRKNPPRPTEAQEMWGEAIELAEEEIRF